jgi:hypothetical protein
LACLGIVAPAYAELAWPDWCVRPGRASGRSPDEIRQYRMRLNDRPAGREVFRFWREHGRVRVLVDTAFDGKVWIFPADLRHCRDELWQEQGGSLELIKIESATRYAVPFKPDSQIRIERDPAQGEVVYRGTSRLGTFEERYPDNTGAVTPWSIRTVAYDRLLDLFAHGDYAIESRLVERASVNGDEVSHYVLLGEWPRHLWYDHEGKMIRFCAQEPFDTYIETVLEAYADREVDALGLNRPCAAMFE